MDSEFLFAFGGVVLSVVPLVLHRIIGFDQEVSVLVGLGLAALFFVAAFLSTPLETNSNAIRMENNDIVLAVVAVFLSVLPRVLQHKFGFDREVSALVGLGLAALVLVAVIFLL